MRKKLLKPDRAQLAILCGIAEILIKNIVDEVPPAKSLFMTSMGCGHCRFIEILMKQSPISENHQFDPEHEFDLCLVFEEDGVLIMLPVELKAGLLAPKIRQTKTAMFALGYMLAILDGQTRVLDLKETKVRYEGNHVQLGHHWGLIARRSVLETLRRNGKLTSKPFVLALEDIFNLVPDEQLAKIVNRIIVREDYKTEWHLH